MLLPVVGYGFNDDFSLKFIYHVGLLTQSPDVPLVDNIEAGKFFFGSFRSGEISRGFNGLDGCAADSFVQIVIGSDGIQHRDRVLNNFLVFRSSIENNCIRV